LASQRLLGCKAKLLWTFDSLGLAAHTIIVLVLERFLDSVPPYSAALLHLYLHMAEEGSISFSSACPKPRSHSSTWCPTLACKLFKRRDTKRQILLPSVANYSSRVLCQSELSKSNGPMMKSVWRKLTNDQTKHKSSLTSSTTQHVFIASSASSQIERISSSK